jgi:hypothetical protein
MSAHISVFTSCADSWCSNSHIRANTHTTGWVRKALCCGVLKMQHHSTQWKSRHGLIVNVKLLYSLPRQSIEFSDQLHVPAALSPRHSRHYPLDKMGPTGGLNFFDKRKILPPSKIKPFAPPTTSHITGCLLIGGPLTSDPRLNVSDPRIKLVSGYMTGPWSYIFSKLETHSQTLTFPVSFQQLITSCWIQTAHIVGKETQYVKTIRVNVFLLHSLQTVHSAQIKHYLCAPA